MYGPETMLLSSSRPSERVLESSQWLATSHASSSDVADRSGRKMRASVGGVVLVAVTTSHRRQRLTPTRKTATTMIF